MNGQGSDEQTPVEAGEQDGGTVTQTQTDVRPVAQTKVRHTELEPAADERAGRPVPALPVRVAPVVVVDPATSDSGLDAPERRAAAGPPLPQPANSHPLSRTCRGVVPAASAAERQAVARDRALPGNSAGPLLPEALEQFFAARAAHAHAEAQLPTSAAPTAAVEQRAKLPTDLQETVLEYGRTGEDLADEAAALPPQDGQPVASRLTQSSSDGDARWMSHSALSLELCVEEPNTLQGAGLLLADIDNMTTWRRDSSTGDARPETASSSGSNSSSGSRAGAEPANPSADVAAARSSGDDREQPRSHTPSQALQRGSIEHAVERGGAERRETSAGQPTSTRASLAGAPALATLAGTAAATARLTRSLQSALAKRSSSTTRSRSQPPRMPQRRAAFWAWTAVLAVFSMTLAYAITARLLAGSANSTKPKPDSSQTSAAMRTNPSGTPP